MINSSHSVHRKPKEDRKHRNLERNMLRRRQERFVSKSSGFKSNNPDIFSDVIKYWKHCGKLPLSTASINTLSAEVLFEHSRNVKASYVKNRPHISYIMFSKNLKKDGNHCKVTWKLFNNDRPGYQLPESWRMHSNYEDLKVEGLLMFRLHLRKLLLNTSFLMTDMEVGVNA